MLEAIQVWWHSARLLGGNPAAKKRSAEALGRLGRAAAVEALLIAHHRQTRIASQRFLPGHYSSQGDPELEPILLDALERLRASRPVKQLAAALRLGVDWPTQRLAAQELGKVGEAGAVNPLLEVHHRSAHHPVREAAFAALCAIRGPQALAAFTEALRASVADTRRTAAAVLGKQGDSAAVMPLTAALGDSNATVRSAAANALGALGDAGAVPALLAGLQDADADVREVIAHALGALADARAVPGLVGALRDRWMNVRLAVVGALGKIPAAAATEPLVSAGFGDPRVEVRRAAAEALAKRDDLEALKRLLAASHAKKDHYVWPVLAIALANRGERSYDELLWSALRGADTRDVSGAAVALSRHGYAPVIAALLAQSDTRTSGAPVPDPALVREALGKLRSADAVEPLLAGIESNRVPRQYPAAWALVRIGDPRAAAPLLKRCKANRHDLGWQAAVASLSQLDAAPSTAEWRAALTAPEPSLRLAATVVLGGAKEPAWIAPLAEQALADADPVVRRGASWAVVRLGDAAASARLLAASRAKDDAEVWPTLAVAHATRGDPHAIAHVIEACRARPATFAQPAILPSFVELETLLRDGPLLSALLGFDGSGSWAAMASDVLEKLGREHAARGDTVAVDLLIAAMDLDPRKRRTGECDDDFNRRETCVVVLLGTAKCARAVPYLLELVEWKGPHSTLEVAVASLRAIVEHDAASLSEAALEQLLAPRSVVGLATESCVGNDMELGSKDVWTYWDVEKSISFEPVRELALRESRRRRAQ